MQSGVDTNVIDAKITFSIRPLFKSNMYVRYMYKDEKQWSRTTFASMKSSGTLKNEPLFLYSLLSMKMSARLDRHKQKWWSLCVIEVEIVKTSENFTNIGWIYSTFQSIFRLAIFNYYKLSNMIKLIRNKKSNHNL